MTGISVTKVGFDTIYRVKVAEGLAFIRFQINWFIAAQALAFKLDRRVVVYANRVNVLDTRAGVPFNTFINIFFASFPTPSISTDTTCCAGGSVANLFIFATVGLRSVVVADEKCLVN